MADLHIEKRVNYDHITPGGFGTADAIVFDGKTLHVVDLKYGTGVKVFAEENFQLMLYASGALAEFDPYGEATEVVVHIVQPRLDHIDSWSVSLEALAEFEAIAKAAAADALSDNPRFGPDPDACRWCLAKSNCQALADYNKETCLAVFAEPEGALKDAYELSAEDLAWALRRSKALKDWVATLQDAAVSRIQSGAEIEGFKVVEGRRLRKWKDLRDAEKALESELGEDAYKAPEIISPAQAEKALGKKHPIFAEQVELPAGKPTLAPASDKRPPLSTAADVFND